MEKTIRFFDLNGTLVNTRPAIIEAYKRIGVDAGSNWDRPWREWCTEEAHRKKDKIYEGVLMELGVEPDWAMNTFLETPEKDCFIFTEGSLRETNVLLEFFPELSSFQFVAEQLATFMRRAIAVALQKACTDVHKNSGYGKLHFEYYDDDVEAGKIITDGTPMKLIAPKGPFLRYSPETYYTETPTEKPF